MAKVSIRKDELERVVEVAKRAAQRTNSVVKLAEDRVDIVEEHSFSDDQQCGRTGESVLKF